MSFNLETVKLFDAPLSWVAYELLFAMLLILVITDIIHKNQDKSPSVLSVRLFEIFGFILYAAIFENLGVICGIYDYPSNRIIMFGAVPLAVPILEAVVFYAAFQFVEKMEFPKWSWALIVASLGLLQDFTLDVVSISDAYFIDGKMQTRWNWGEKLQYPDMFFGIPYFNFTGWFALMFYYTVLIQLGRKYFEARNQTLSAGIKYVLFVVIIGDILILSPFTLTLLFMNPNPFSALFGNGTKEFTMFILLGVICMSVLLFTRKRTSTFSIKEYPAIWVIPTSMHLLDMTVFTVKGLNTAILPVLIICTFLHFAYMAYCLSGSNTATSLFRVKH